MLDTRALAAALLLLIATSVLPRYATSLAIAPSSARAKCSSRCGLSYRRSSFVCLVSVSRDDNFVSPSDLGLADRFDRWRFLQRLLDEEDDPSYTTTILFSVLRTFLDSRVADVDDDEPSSSPSLTEPTRQIIQDVVQESSALLLQELLSTNESNKQGGDSENSRVWILAKLEQLLPDPVDDEDAFKGLWDTVIELHGRESVKINERNGGTTSWRTRCLVARILLYYDFLTKGL